MTEWLDELIKDYSVLISDQEKQGQKEELDKEETEERVDAKEEETREGDVIQRWKSREIRYNPRTLKWEVIVSERRVVEFDSEKEALEFLEQA